MQKQKQRNRKVWFIHKGKKKKQPTETYRGPEVGINRDLRVAFINTFKELKETILTEVKEAMIPVSHQIESINKKTAIMKKNQMDVLEPKKTKNKKMKWRTHESSYVVDFDRQKEQSANM